MPSIQKEHASRVKCPKCGAGEASIMLVVKHTVKSETWRYVVQAGHPKHTDQELISDTTRRQVFRCINIRCEHEWPVPWWWDGTLRPVYPTPATCLESPSRMQLVMKDASSKLPEGSRVVVQGGELKGQHGEVKSYGVSTVEVMLDGHRNTTRFWPNELTATGVTVDAEPSIVEGCLFSVGDTIRVRGGLRDARVTGRRVASDGNWEYQRTATNPKATCDVWVSQKQAREEWTPATPTTPAFKVGDIVRFGGPDNPSEDTPLCVLLESVHGGWDYVTEEPLNSPVGPALWTSYAPKHATPPRKSGWQSLDGNPRIEPGAIAILCEPRLLQSAGDWSEKTIGMAVKVTYTKRYNFSATSPDGMAHGIRYESLTTPGVHGLWPARDCIFIANPKDE